MLRSVFIGWVCCLVLAGCAHHAPSAPQTEIGPKPIVFDAFLWQATRDTLALMPVATADPLAGRLVTEWAKPSGGDAHTRYRVTVGLNYESDYAHAILITVDRQRLDADWTWQDDGQDNAIAAALANAIATHAGELRLAENHPS
jgi:hypothetical protein